MGDDFMLEFEYSSKNSWKIINEYKVFILLGLVFLLYFLYTGDERWQFLVIGELLIFLPAVLLHIQYFFNDKGKKIVVNYSKDRIQVFKKVSLLEEFKISQILEIIRFKGRADEYMVGYTLSMSCYNYTKIKFQDGRHLVFTDLISRKISFKNPPKKVRIRFLNFIW